MNCLAPRVWFVVVSTMILCTGQSASAVAAAFLGEVHAPSLATACAALSGGGTTVSVPTYLFSNAGGTLASGAAATDFVSGSATTCDGNSWAVGAPAQTLTVSVKCE